MVDFTRQLPGEIKKFPDERRSCAAQERVTQESGTAESHSISRRLAGAFVDDFEACLFFRLVLIGSQCAPIALALLAVTGLLPCPEDAQDAQAGDDDEHEDELVST